VKLNKNIFYDKVLGCWMGKNIGGTLGAPVEWYRQINDFSFYSHDINGEPLPNDDLDLQIIWLKALEDRGIRINAQTLAEYWLDYEIAPSSEYGICKVNLNAGFMPPLSGTIGNGFKNSCGAFIRSEIWACICPGSPDLAVKYCYEDAIVDHGNGEGTYATFFTGAMEAAAFVESDFRKLIKIGLSYIPESCGVAQAVYTAIECYDKGLSWVECRDTILERHRGYSPLTCSERDKEKGFDKGELGYDAPENIGVIVAGMLYGEGDFEKTMCITVNMGEDADCTCGTVGALFGIIYGMSEIPKKWIEPIGHNIQTICINLSASNFAPATVEELTERTVAIAQKVSKEFNGMNIFEDGDTDFSDVKADDLMCKINPIDILLPMNGPRYENDVLTVALDYSQNHLELNKPVKLSLLIHGGDYHRPMNVRFNWMSTDNLTVSPQNIMNIPILQRQARLVEKLDLYVTAEAPRDIYEAVIELKVFGRHSRLYVPVLFTSFNRTDEKDLEN